MAYARWFVSALVLFAAVSVGQAQSPKKLLLVAQGPDGHPPQTHEYVAGLQVLAKLLRPAPGLEVELLRADEPWKEGPELLERADGVVLFLSEGARWSQHDPRRLEALARVARRGGGLGVLHWGMGTKDAKNIQGFVNLLGACHGGPDRKFKVLETDAQPVAHPVTAGIAPFKVKDEFYYRLKLVETDRGFQSLLKATIDGNAETVAWAWERPDGGRSFGFSGLHYHDNWKLLPYRRLVTQGVLWTMKQPLPEKGLAVEIAEKDLELK